MNSASIDTGVQVSVCVPVFHFLGDLVGSGIAESYGNSAFTFLRTHYTFPQCSDGLQLYENTYITLLKTAAVRAAFFSNLSEILNYEKLVTSICNPEAQFALV